MLGFKIFRASPHVGYVKMCISTSSAVYFRTVYFVRFNKAPAPTNLFSQMLVIHLMK